MVCIFSASRVLTQIGIAAQIIVPIAHQCLYSVAKPLFYVSMQAPNTDLPWTPLLQILRGLAHPA